MAAAPNNMHDRDDSGQAWESPGQLVCTARQLQFAPLPRSAEVYAKLTRRAAAKTWILSVALSSCGFMQSSGASSKTHLELIKDFASAI